MHPTIARFSLFGAAAQIPTYGLLVATGFVVGAWLAEREARRRGEDPRPILDACFWALVGGLAGSRVLFVATNAAEYWQICRGGAVPRGGWRAFVDCTKALQFWEGGIVYYGGFAGGLAGVVWALRRRHAPFLPAADALAPSLAIGHAFGRLGCYMAGCCFGAPTGGAWGARFPRDAIAFSEMTHDGSLPAGADRTPPIHPTQLYEAAGEIAIFAALLAVRRRKRVHGQVFLAYLAAYPVLRSLIELFRGDAARKFVVPGIVSTSQAISAVVLVAALILWRRLRADRR